MNDPQNAPKPDEQNQGDATPHDPGVGPKPDDAAKKPGPSEHAPYEKQPEPAQQPS